MFDINVAEIAFNLQRIKDNISDACWECGRSPEEIKLIAVSKTKPWPMVDSAIQAGQRFFGENTMQDALTKIPYSKDRRTEWHFIGHLQSNKAKNIPGNFAWVHSVDSEELASKLSQSAENARQQVNILIQVNVTADKKKYGVYPEGVFGVIEAILEAGLPGLNLRGLMTIGLHETSESEIRPVFAKLRELRDICRDRFALQDFTELSMGMSGDYVCAIKEGATMIRIGTSLFGARF